MFWVYTDCLIHAHKHTEITHTKKKKPRENLTVRGWVPLTLMNACWRLYTRDDDFCVGVALFLRRLRWLGWWPRNMLTSLTTLKRPWRTMTITWTGCTCYSEHGSDELRRQSRNKNSMEEELPNVLRKVCSENSWEILSPYTNIKHTHTLENSFRPRNYHVTIIRIS